MGRKAIHKFNQLEIGEKSELKGKAKIHPHQFKYQYNKDGARTLKIVREGNKVYAERVK
jgi:hypothetical protein